MRASCVSLVLPAEQSEHTTKACKSASRGGVGEYNAASADEKRSKEAREHQVRTATLFSQPTTSHSTNNKAHRVRTENGEIAGHASAHVAPQRQSHLATNKQTT